jgi:hypothetical protein
MENKNVLTIILSVVLVAAIIVTIVLYTSSQSQISNINSQLNTANLNINSSASQFDSQFSGLLQEHAYLLTDMARRSLTSNSSASFNATLSALQTNINQVGALLQPIYGNNSQELVNLYNQKANVYINYTNSLRNGDPNAEAYYDAANAIYQQQFIAFWSNTNNPYPSLAQALTQQQASSTAGGVKRAIDDWYNGNYVAYYQDLQNAFTTAGIQSDTIAQAIIIQNPQDFQ